MSSKNSLSSAESTQDTTKDRVQVGESESQSINSKVYVLLHGAWHGAWCWKYVTPRLRAAGHLVYTPTQTGLGERSHLLSEAINLELFIRDIVNVLQWEDLTEVILVGHSFGGIVISGVADRLPHRIKHLVYLDALLLQDGQSAFSQIPAEIVDARRETARQFSQGLSMPVPTAEAFGVYDLQQSEWLQEKCTPHPIATYEDTLQLDNPLANGLPASYIAVTPYYGPTAASRKLARQQRDWDYIEIEAGHDAMVTSAARVADILLRI